MMDGFLRQMTHTHTATNVSAYFQVGTHRISLTFQSNGGADSFYFFNFPIGYCGNDFRLFTKMYFYSYLFILLFEAVAALTSFVYMDATGDVAGSVIGCDRRR